MFRRLVMNTALSAGAFLVISIAGVLITPVLVNTYGLAAFGLITIARLFLPSGVLAVVDLGLSEVTIQVIARARETLDWKTASRQFSLLVVAGLVLGAVAALLLGLNAGGLATLMRAPAELRPGFILTIVCTAAALPLLFLSLVAEGLLKGFERYEVIRGLEVGSTALYAALVLGAVAMGMPFETAALAYVAALAMRAIAVIAVSLAEAGRAPLRPARWAGPDVREVALRSGVLTYGRVLGSLQGQAPPLLIGALGGPAAAGLYDVLTRLPRFMKSVLGLISSTLVPVAIRLDARNHTDATRKLTGTGLLVVTMVALPVTTACMFYAKEILELWIGPQAAGAWPWLSLMFVQPLIMPIVGFGSTILLGRVGESRRLNAVTTLQVVLQLAISLALIGQLQEKAFILGQILAVCVTFPMSMAIITRATQLSQRVYLWLLQGAVLAGLFAAAFWFAPRPADLLHLAVLSGAWVAGMALAMWLVAPTREERALLWRMLAVLIPQGRKEDGPA